MEHRASVPGAFKLVYLYRRKIREGLKRDPLGSFQSYLTLTHQNPDLFSRVQGFFQVWVEGSGKPGWVDTRGRMFILIICLQMARIDGGLQYTTMHGWHPSP